MRFASPSAINSGEPAMIRRRDFVLGVGAAAFAAPAVVRAQQPTVIKMGALKLIHSIAPHFYDRFTPAGYQVEVIPFESPTEGKNAVVTKSVDFGCSALRRQRSAPPPASRSW